MKIKFGKVAENITTRKEFPLEKAQKVLKGKTIAVLGYGIQGPGQALNMRDNGFNVIVGQRKNTKAGSSWMRAKADGWVEGKTLFSLEEAAEKGDIIMMLVSDGSVGQVWKLIEKSVVPASSSTSPTASATFTASSQASSRRRASASSWSRRRARARPSAATSSPAPASTAPTPSSRTA